MGRLRLKALLILAFSAACGRGFICRPHVGVVPGKLQHWHRGQRHVTTESRFGLSKTITTCPRKAISPLSTGRSDADLVKICVAERENGDAKGPRGLLKLTAPVLAVGVFAAAGVLSFPHHAAAAAPLVQSVSMAAGGFQMPLALTQLFAHPLAALAANPEWTRYAFMLPVGMFVATCAQTAGIGGAAIMGPFFVLGLPLIGPGYPLHSVAASIATAIVCEAFGFSSGLFGYFRRGLIDPGSATPFILASLPACLLGALVVPYADERVLKALYAVFMLALSAYLLFDEGGSESLVPEECSVEELESGEIRAVCSTDGQEYIYKRPDFGAGSGFTTAFGGLLTGMLGVGIGEVVIPQLVKKNGVPLPVAAGTSVLVVFLNAVVAAATQMGGIISRGPEEVPWNLIAFLVPGVIIGGQLAPTLQGKLSQRTMEKALAGVFGCIGATFATISVESLLAMSSASASAPLP